MRVILQPMGSMYGTFTVALTHKMTMEHLGNDTVLKTPHRSQRVEFNFYLSVVFIVFNLDYTNPLEISYQNPSNLLWWHNGMRSTRMFLVATYKIWVETLPARRFSCEANGSRFVDSTPKMCLLWRARAGFSGISCQHSWDVRLISHLSSYQLFILHVTGNCLTSKFVQFTVPVALKEP